MKKKRFSPIVIVFIFLFQIFSSFTSSNVKAADVANTLPFITGVSLTNGNGKDLGNDVPKDSDVRIQYDFSIPNTGDVKSGSTYTMQIPSQIAIVHPLSIPIKDDSGNLIAAASIDTNGKVVMTFTDYASTHSNVKGYFYVSASFDKDDIGGTNPVSIVFQLGGNSEPVTINVNFDQPVPLPTSVVKSGSYDAATNTITWKMEVNKEKVAVNSGQLMDDIPIGQQYVDGSASIDNSADASKFSYIAADSGNTSKTGTLTYKFPDTINKTYNITFKTKVTDPNAFSEQGKSTQEYNTAVLKHDDTTTTSNTASVTVKSDYINKNGRYVDISSDSGPVAGRINWTIKVNNNALSLTNVKITDPIPQGLTLTSGSFKVDGKDSTDYTYNNNILEYTFNGTINEPHTITFSTDVTDPNAYNSNDKKTYTNTVSMTGEGVPGTISDSSNGVGVPTSVISKQGSEYNASTGEIKWTVTVNSNRISIDNAVVTDDIPIGQKYVYGSWSLTPEDSHSPSGGFSYTAADSDDKSKTGILQYKFTGTINSTYTITFKTKVTDNKVFAGNSSKTYQNTIIINGDNLPKPSSSTGKQAVNSQVINKSGTAYDYVTREVTWKVVVNKNAMPIKEALVTDVINDGQDFVPGSVTINEAAAEAGSYSYDSSNRAFKYTLGDISTQQVITFKTRITDLSIFQTNGDKTVSNTSSLSGDIIPSGVNSTGTRKITNKVIDKTGAYEWGKDYIDWTVNVNSNAIPLDNGSIKDTLKQGLQLDTSSVALKKMILKADGTLSDGDSVALTGSNIKYDTDRNFTFTFPNSIDGAYQLTFRTYITDPSKGPFTNTATFNGSKADNQGSTSTQIDVYNGSGGGGSGETGSIKVVKVDETGLQPLKGAIFQLVDQYGNSIRNSSPTMEDGSAVFSKLRYDINYSIKEIEAPTGYNLEDKPYTFKISTSSTGEKNIIYSFKDNKIVGNIELCKIGKNDNPLQGAVFTLYNSDGKTSIKDSDGKDITAVSGRDGKAKFINIPYGKYVIKETKAPSGYNASSESINADLTNITENGQTVHADPYNISNIQIPGGGGGGGKHHPKASIKLTKTGEGADSKALKGAEFSLYNTSDLTKDIAVETSDVKGIVEFDNVSPGSYIIKETKAPEGYIILSQALTVNVGEKDDGSIINLGLVSDTKSRGGIKILKLDALTLKPVSGAAVTIYTDDGKQIGSGLKGLTGKDGTVEFDNLPYGDYYFVETSAPAGYFLNTDKHPFTVRNNGVILQYTFEDTKIPDVNIKGEIEITKIDAKGRLLKGAEFTLYKHGQVVDRAVSDSDGIAKFQNVDYGTYTLNETKAPKGYVLNNKTLNVTVNSTELQKFIVKDEISPNDGGGNPGKDTNTPGSGPDVNPNPGKDTPSLDNPSKTPDSSYKSTSNGSILPKTGSMIDSTVLTIIGILAILMGVVLAIRNRKLNK